jgi:excinuclease ABC subunit A
VRKLLVVLHSLVAQGNTVLVIEHNLDIIKNSEYLVDMGPEGGEAGGRVIAKGTVAEVAATPGSYTGEWLTKLIETEKSFPVGKSAPPRFQAPKAEPGKAAAPKVAERVTDRVSDAAPEKAGSHPAGFDKPAVKPLPAVFQRKAGQDDEDSAPRRRGRPPKTVKV